MLELDEESLRQKINKVEELDLSLNNLIGTLLNSKDFNDKHELEICQVGKFLSILGENSFIIERRESPDFVIELNQRKIGIENERILNPFRAEQVQSIKSLFSDAAKQFRSKYPERKLLVNFYLESDNFSFSKTERKLHIETICNYVFCLIKELNVEKPKFISSIYWMENVSTSFNYIESNFESQALTNEVLLKAINRKNSLVSSYKRKTDIEEQWLLLLIGNLSSDSYYVDNPIEIEVESEFNRIYLLEDFKSILHRIK